MNVEIKDMPAKRLATVRHSGPYNQIGEAFGRLGAVAGPAGLFNSPDVAMIAMYYDDPDATPVDQLRSDAGITVPEGTALPSPLVEQRLPAGRYASTIHVGPYDRLGDTWARFLGEWIPASGHQLGPGASFEIYLNDMRTTPKEKLETAIYVPIE